MFIPLRRHFLFSHLHSSLTLGISRIVLPERVLEVDGSQFEVNNRIVKEKALRKFLQIKSKVFYDNMLAFVLRQHEWENDPADKFAMDFSTLFGQTIEEYEDKAKKDLAGYLKIDRDQSYQLIQKFNSWHQETLNNCRYCIDVVLMDNSSNVLKVDRIFTIIAMGVKYAMTNGVKSFCRLNSFMDALAQKSLTKREKSQKLSLQLTELIREDNLAMAFDLLNTQFKGKPDDLNTLVLLQRNCNELEKSRIRGGIEDANYTRERGKIIISLLEIINKI